MTTSKRPDELSLRYQEACAQDSRRPSERVRAAVHAHAAMVISAKQTELTRSTIQRPPAANQSRWKLSLLASIAVLGLTGLLVMQFDRGTPEEQELGLGRPRPSTTPAPATITPPLQSPAVAQATEGDNESVKKISRKPRAAPAPKAKLTQPAMPAPVPERRALALMAGPASPPLSSTNLQSPATEPAPVTAGMSAKLADAANAKDLTALLLARSRAGQLPQVERLLQQGALINAPDAAGRTPLILATMNGHTALVARLLALGANPSLTDDEGLTALQHARRLGHQQIADLLGG